jgi:hypothetical protein
LERIASKRKHFFSNSKILKDELDMMAASPQSPGIGLASRAFSSPSTYSVVGSSGLSNSRTGSPLRPSQRSAERFALVSSPPQPMLNDRGYGTGSSSSSFEPPGSFLPGPASSVIAAFRQLQTKARQIEQERAEGIRERDELRRQLDGNMRTQSFWRSQSDLQANDSFQTMRAATEQILATKRDLEMQVMAASEKHMSHQRSNASDRALLLTIENELAEVKANIHVVQAQNRAVEHELAATQGRCERVAHTVEASPDARLKQVLY